jgi:hypothetical protein
MRALDRAQRRAQAPLVLDGRSARSASVVNVV